MFLNAMMMLGCWTGSVDLTHKFTGDGVCDEYSLKVAYDEATQKLNVQKLALSCPEGFDTAWTQLDFRLGEGGALWLKPLRGDEKIVGWFRDGEFHAEDALNAWMYNFWNAKYVADEGAIPVETLQWEDRLIRSGEIFWSIRGSLSRVSCSEFDLL